VHYNPYGCWYKRSFNGHDSPHFVRLDRSRFDLLAGHIAFDADREIVAVPAWEEILAMMAAHEDRPAPAGPVPPLTDPMIEQWGAAVLAGDEAGDAGAGAGAAARSFDGGADPCDGCEAHCCSTLVFPQAVPTHASNLDYFRFCLGFPGVELNVMDGAWGLVVKTTCRHLVDGRCSVYGQPERPLVCRYYDALKCEYKPQVGVPRPAQSMRVRLEQFAGLVAALELDADGTVVGVPPLEVLRTSVVATWQPVAITAPRPARPTQPVPVYEPA
jgi:hypothetical protein